MAQRVLITAGAAGIRRGIAIAFTKRDVKIFICDIDAKALEKTAREIPESVTKVCDVWNRKAVEEMNPDDWGKVMQVNLNGTLNVTRLVIPHLKKCQPAPSTLHFFKQL